MFEKVRDLLADQLDYDPANITPETSIEDDIGADSLDIVEFIGTLEDEFNITIPQSDLVNISTVGDLVKLVEKLV